ncbi:MAG TPA: EthD domain-containing protein [Acidimicrobiia bacterium]
MQKLIFLFGRKPGLSHDEFARHYLEVHAPLGRRVTRAMAGYVVNLVEHVDERGARLPELDAITEIWTPSVEDFFDPALAFTSAEDGRELLADHESFIGPMHAYLVAEHTPKMEPAVSATGSRTPGVKHIALVGPADAGASAGDTVVRTLTPDATEVAAFVALRAGAVDELERRSPAPGYLVAEFVMVTPDPQPGGAGRGR